MTNKPNILEWCKSPQGAKNEYPSEKKEIGWKPGEIPPCEWENYFKNEVTNWISYFDEQIARISIVGVPRGVALATFPSLSKDSYRCSAVEKADEFGFVLCNGQVINDDSAGDFHGKIIPNLNSNKFLKGSIHDNESNGNLNNKINIDHTHNYAHTHETMQYEIDKNYTPKIRQLFNKTPDFKESHWDQIITYNGYKNPSVEGGDTPQIVAQPIAFTTFYTSGVSGASVNGCFDKAETLGITSSEKAIIDIEPENITTVYIMRIK